MQWFPATFLCVAMLLLWMPARADETSTPISASRIQLEKTGQQLHIRARHAPSSNWVSIATYVMDPQLRPYLHPVRDPLGQVVLTADRPSDHPWQHGIFTGFHQVNGFNYWKEDQGQQRFIRLLQTNQAPDRVFWRALVEWVDPNGNIVMEEENGITMHAPESPDLYVVDFELLLRAREHQVNFRKFFVGGLAVRMPWDQSNPRHTHLNSNGLRGRAGEQKRASWCTVERPLDEKWFGIAVFDHPQNANHPPAWRVDEQGLINPNVSALENWSMQPKEERVFQYRLLIYRGTKSKEELDRRFAEFKR